MAIEVIRLLNLSASKEQIKRIELFVSPEVADYLQNEKRAAITQIEHISDKRVVIHSKPEYAGDYSERMEEIFAKGLGAGGIPEPGAYGTVPDSAIRESPSSALSDNS